jgi:hypothetical protein
VVVSVRGRSKLILTTLPTASASSQHDSKKDKSFVWEKEEEGKKDENVKLDFTTK